MPTHIASLLRTGTRGGPLNILTCPTHEAYETNLCRTGHNFYAWRGQGLKDWNGAFRPLPPNYTLLDPALGDDQLPPGVVFDVVLSQHKFGQFQVLAPLARKLHLPLISLEHTLPPETWPKGKKESLKQMRGDANVFISDYSRTDWGWGDDEAVVVPHGIDTDLFSPNDLLVEKKNHLLSVVNDWKNRDFFCGFHFWEEATAGLPTFVVGDTPGLSRPAASVQELVLRYREATVFVNTSRLSPVPTALMEAMACGCAVVSTNNCAIPELIVHNQNGVLCDSPQEMRAACTALLEDRELSGRLGSAARTTILQKHSLRKFVERWDELLRETAHKPFLGATT